MIKNWKNEVTFYPLCYLLELLKHCMKLSKENMSTIPLLPRGLGFFFFDVGNLAKKVIPSAHGWMLFTRNYNQAPWEKHGPNSPFPYGVIFEISRQLGIGSGDGCFHSWNVAKLLGNTLTQFPLSFKLFPP